MDRKLKQLNAIDVLVLSIIFFGWAIYHSTLYFLADPTGADSTDFLSDSQQTRSIIYAELGSLLVAFAYLYWRKFDFKQLNFSVDRYTLPQIIGFVLLTGSITHLYYGYFLPVENIATADELVETTENSFSLASYFTLDLILASLVNGFYEELFFLGLAFVVPRKNLPYVIVFCLIVRFAFHTYQGIASAIGITLLGLIFTLLRLKTAKLVPFMLAHSFFDVFGSGLPLWLFDY